MKKIIVSNCLLGMECRYKGDSCRSEAVCALKDRAVLIGVCPEQMGGLSTPRNPAERVGDRVISSAGADVTAEYNKGAESALLLAKMNGATLAILKAKSPSCGKGLIYDGTFTGNKIPGNGVTVELLEKNGIRVFTEEDVEKGAIEAYL